MHLNHYFTSFISHLLRKTVSFLLARISQVSSFPGWTHIFRPLSKQTNEITSFQIDSKLGNISITRFLIYRTLAALLERCVLGTFYLPVLKIFVSLLGFEPWTFSLEKNQKATNLTILPKKLCNRKACFV